MTPGTPNPRGRADRRAASVHRAARRRSVRRQRLLAAAVLAIVAGMAALIILQQGGQTRVPADATGSPAPSRSPSRSFGVGIRVLQLINHSRTVQLPTGPAPRSLLTYVRYPSLAVGSRVDVPDAAAPRSQGPFPLVVFGHGFDVTPALYARLLQAWTSAGYVVAPGSTALSLLVLSDTLRSSLCSGDCFATKPAVSSLLLRQPADRGEGGPALRGFAGDEPPPAQALCRVLSLLEVGAQPGHRKERIRTSSQGSR